MARSQPIEPDFAPQLAASRMVKGDRQKKKAAADLVTRECTVNLNKRLHGITFKKRAPRAVRELRKFGSRR